MELTLALSPADAARLSRLPAIRAGRTGRTRGQAVRIVWHDSLERELAAQGLALAEQRGHWRLERHYPAATEPWPPATDHRLIAEADGPDSLRHVLADPELASEPDRLPDAITPVAAFDGRRTVVPLTIDDAAISLAVLDGTLRSVAAERPAARIVLDGPAAPLRTLLLALNQSLTLTVPTHSLAAAAFALADGTEPKPRRYGPPELPSGGLAVLAAFGHIVGHLTDVILSIADQTTDPDSGPEPVHQMRVAVRRMRSAFSLFRPVLGDAVPAETVAGLKQLNQILGPARDWDVFMTETAPPIEVVLPDEAALPPLLRAGARRRGAARDRLSEFLAGAAFRRLMLELAWLAAASEQIAVPVEPPNAPPLTLDEFAASTLRRRWKKLVNTGKGLDDLDDVALHDLRLKAKRLRYAAEFFGPLFGDKSAGKFIRRLADLQDQLGAFNDTTTARGLLRDLGGKPGFAAGLVLGFTAAHGERARSKIDAAWARFRRRAPFWE